MPKSASRWTAREPGGTMSSSKGCGDRSNTKRSISTPTSRFRRHAPALAGIWHSIMADAHIHLLTGKHPIRSTSISRSQYRSRHDQRRKPLSKTSETVQTNRATSKIGTRLTLGHVGFPRQPLHLVERLEEGQCLKRRSAWFLHSLERVGKFSA